MGNRRGAIGYGLVVGTILLINAAGAFSEPVTAPPSNQIVKSSSYQFIKEINLDEIQEAVAIDSHFGKLFIADHSGKQVFITTMDGATIKRVGVYGNEDGKFLEPLDAISDFNYWIFVVDRSKNNVQRFDRYGSFQSSFGEFGVSNGQLNNPKKISVDLQGRLYILDDNKRVSVFSNDGLFLNTIASFGTGEGFLSDPIDLAVDNSFAVYVLEKDSHRVQKFDRSSEFLKAFDTLENPIALTLDAEAKKIYVLYVGRIQTFDLNGNIIDDFKNEKIGSALDFVKVKNTFYILQGKKLLVISARE